MSDTPGPFPIEVVAHAHAVRPGRPWHVAVDLVVSRFPHVSREAATELIEYLGAMPLADRQALEAVLSPHPLISYCTEE